MRIFLILLLFTGLLLAQAPAKKQHFLVRIQPARATFVSDMTAVEQKVMAEHFEYSKKLMGAGKVILAGPSINGEKTFGIIIVEVDSEAEAQGILEGDPSYKAGIQKGEVLPFQLALLRGSEP